MGTPVDRHQEASPRPAELGLLDDVQQLAPPARHPMPDAKRGVGARRERVEAACEAGRRDPRQRVERWRRVAHRALLIVPGRTPLEPRRPSEPVWSTSSVSDELDLGEAADYILGERPGLGEDAVWAVLNELQTPPPPATEALALDLIASTHPEIERRDAKLVLREWRAYAELAGEDDWD